MFESVCFIFVNYLTLYSYAQYNSNYPVAGFADRLGPSRKYV
jgi:hypothetical protein